VAPEADVLAEAGAGPDKPPSERGQRSRIDERGAHVGVGARRSHVPLVKTFPVAAQHAADGQVPAPIVERRRRAEGPNRCGAAGADREVAAASERDIARRERQRVAVRNDRVIGPVTLSRMLLMARLAELRPIVRLLDDA